MRELIGRRRILSLIGIVTAASASMCPSNVSAAQVKTFQYFVKPVGSTFRIPIQGSGDIHVYVDGRRMSEGSCNQGCDYVIDRNAGEIVISALSIHGRARVVIDYV